MDSTFLIINSELHLPLAELQYRFARSGGPGGQHVNKTETQVELLFDVAHSPSLTDAQRQRLLTKLKNVIDQEGVLHLTVAIGAQSTAQPRGGNGTLSIGRGGGAARAEETSSHPAHGGLQDPAHRKQETARADQTTAPRHSARVNPRVQPH